MRALLLVCLLLAPALTIAAPAPPRRAAPDTTVARLDEFHIVGTWTETWGDSTGTATFTLDGKYDATWHGGHWVGRWALDAAGDLAIEFTLEENGLPIETMGGRVVLARNAQGRIDPAKLTGTIDVPGAEANGARYALKKKD